MVRFSSTGKPICGSCRNLAAYEVRALDRVGDQVFYVYQCVNHRHASSRLLTSTHIDGLSLDQRFYQRFLFEAYLASGLDLVVGCTADERLCPLAHFYSLYYETPALVTFGGCVRAIDGDRLLCHLPSWAMVFTLAVDFTHSAFEITGQQALALLNGGVL
jgi:hypothetical protein